MPTETIVADASVAQPKTVRSCDGCTTYIDQIRQTIAISGRIDEGALSPKARETLLAAFRDWADTRG